MAVWQGFLFMYIAELVEVMKTNPYSLLVDGSNDTGVDKLNPLTVKIFDIQRSQAHTYLLDMCTTSGWECGTAETIFNKIDDVLTKLSIPWSFCVGFGVDNTSVNIGLHNSIMARVRQKKRYSLLYGLPVSSLAQCWKSCI